MWLPGGRYRCGSRQGARLSRHWAGILAVALLLLLLGLLLSGVI